MRSPKWKKKNVDSECASFLHRNLRRLARTAITLLCMISVKTWEQLPSTSLCVTHNTHIAHYLTSSHSFGHFIVNICLLLYLFKTSRIVSQKKNAFLRTFILRHHKNVPIFFIYLNMFTLLFSIRKWFGFKETAARTKQNKHIWAPVAIIYQPARLTRTRIYNQGKRAAINPTLKATCKIEKLRSYFLNRAMTSCVWKNFHRRIN